MSWAHENHKGFLNVYIIDKINLFLVETLPKPGNESCIFTAQLSFDKVYIV